MAAATEHDLRQDQLESFGRIMAGFSHEMKNHLGIIRESNGLVEDYLAMVGCNGDAKMMARLEKALATVERRVVVAANMLHHLSGFWYEQRAQATPAAPDICDPGTGR